MTVKKLFFAVVVLFCLLRPSQSFAQDTLIHNRSVQQIFNEIFSELNLARLPSPFLWEKSYAKIKVDTLKYSALNSIFIDYNDFRQFYLDMYNATTSPGLMLPIDSLDERLSGFDTTDARGDTVQVIPIGLIYMVFSRIKSDAFTSNTLAMSDSMIVDGTNTIDNPYYLDTVLIAAPLVKRLYGRSFKFVIPQRLVITSPGITIDSVDIDMHDGNGLQHIKINQKILVSLNPTDSAVNITLSNPRSSGSVHVDSRSILNTVTAYLPSGDPDMVRDGMKVFPMPCNMTDLYPNEDAAIYVKFSQHNSHKGSLKFDKPLIFIEGLDLGTDPPKYLPANSKVAYDDGARQFGDIGWDQFYSGIEDKVYPQLHYAKYFIDSALGAGYDVIIVDFKQCSNAIEANTNVFLKIVRYVKDNQYGNEPLVVIGGSMGGLIARYGLSIMEKQGCNSCVRLMGTWDSPHQGANVLPGLQKFVQFGAYDLLDNTAISAVKLLQSPAVEQMLYFHEDGNGCMDTYKHDNWQNKLSNAGYPQNLRKIAIANGSKNGYNSGFNAGDKIVTWNFSKVLPPINISMNIWAMPGVNYNGYTQDVFYMKVYNALSFGYLKTGHYSFAGCDPQNFDNCPGSLNDNVSAAVGPQYSQITTKIKLYIGTITALHTLTSFVPTVCGLDIKPSEWQPHGGLWYDVRDSINGFYPQRSKYPFDASYVPDSNQLHVMIDYIKGPKDSLHNDSKWLMNQIIKSENNLTANLPNTHGNNYNLGAYHNMLYTLNINNGGKLFINNGTNTDYGWGLSASASNLDVFTNPCGATVAIDSGGVMVLGDSVPGNEAFQATVRITKGSQLVINKGGTLIISNNSMLKVEAGAELDYNGGTIVLMGANAILEIDGKIVVGNNATFTFKNSTNSHPHPWGFMRIVETTAGANIDAGTNSKIYIGGADVNTKLLEIRGGQALETPNWLTLITIENAKVEMDQGCKLNIYSPLTMNNVKVDIFYGAASGSLHGGVRTYGQPGVNLSNVTISHGAYGFYGFSNGTYHNTPNVSGTFTLNTKGIYLYDIPLNFTGGTVNNNSDYGIQIEAAGYTSNNNVNGSMNNNGITGLSFTGGSSGDYMHFSGNLETNSYYGAYIEQCTYYSRCGNYYQNGLTNLYADGADLELAPHVNTGVTGDNQFSSVGKNIDGYNAITLKLAHGRNKFEYGPYWIKRMKMTLSGQMKKAPFAT